MRNLLLSFLVSAALFVASPIWAASPMSTLRETINSASKADNAASATALVNSAMQAEQMALAQQKNPNVAREWEELLYRVKR